MARAHAVAMIIIDAADQQSLGFGVCGLIIAALVVELGLHRLKEISIEDGGLLPSKHPTPIDHLSEVEPVAQKMGERAAGKRDSPNRAARLERPDLGHDPPLPQVDHQPVEAAKSEIAAEDRANPLGLLFHHNDSAVLGLV